MVLPAMQLRQLRFPVFVSSAGSKRLFHEHKEHIHAIHKW
jgi:hypothetical protein